MRLKLKVRFIRLEKRMVNNMDVDKIIEKLEMNKIIVFNSPVDENLKCGYNLCLGDLKELIGYKLKIQKLQLRQSCFSSEITPPTNE